MLNLPVDSGVELPQNQPAQTQVVPQPFKRKRALVLAIFVVLLMIAIGGYFYLQTLPAFRYRQEIKKIDSLISGLQSLTPEYVASVYPGHPEVQDQGVGIAKFNVEEPLRMAKEAFEKGNTEEGRKYLLQVEKYVRTKRFVGDPKEGLWIDPAIKQKHDPLDKYITNAYPSEVWRDTMYLPIIDILVSTDRGYR